MRRGLAIVLGSGALLVGAMALAWTGVIPLPAGVRDWLGDPEHRPTLLASTDDSASASATDTDGAGEGVDPNDAAMRSYREAFAAASSFSPNPDEPIGIYKFDLAIREHVDSHLANGEINYYVNTADGSIGLFDLESIRQAMGGQAIPGVTYEFAVLRGAGNALMCGQSVEYGKACIQAGGDATPGATNWSLDYGNMNEFLRSVANTPPTAMATPVPNTSDMRGTAYEGSTMTLWYDNVPSTVPTEQPWLGFCSGLFKDYLAQVNRVARYVVHEGADTDGGDITCQLLDFRMQQRSFDTGSYPLVTAFTTQGIEESTDIGRRAMRGEMSCEQLAEEMREFARKRGLPVPDDTPCK